MGPRPSWRWSEPGPAAKHPGRFTPLKKISSSLLVIVLFAAGCNWAHLMEFRGQMSRSREFVDWEMRSGESVLVFKNPVLTLADLESAGVYATRLDAGHAMIKYEWIEGPPGIRGDCHLTLLLADGRLAGLVFPRALQDGLGRENIVGLLAMVGDRRDPLAGLSPLPKQQLLAAGWARDLTALGTEFRFILKPWDPRNRAMIFTLSEKQTPETYSHFHLKLI